MNGAMRSLERLWRLRHPILLLVVLQVFDTFSTLLALGVGGGEEANPVMAAALGAAGGVGLASAKWAVVALVFVAVALDPGKGPYVPAALWIMNVVYAIVLSGNFAAYGLATGSWALPVAFWALVLALAIVGVDRTFFTSRSTNP